MNLDEEILIIKNKAAAENFSNAQNVEEFRIKYISKKGEMNVLLEKFKQLDNETKKVAGKKVNELKQFLENLWETQKNNFENEVENTQKIDFSLPSNEQKIGNRHPLKLVEKQMVEIFNRLGFTVEDGPEIESDWYNFSALNFPEDHPARDMQDTFFIENEISLRTHTSSVQVRIMENNQPPIRVIMPGRVYRNEAISARAHCFFHQIEGLYIDEKVSFADLKQTLFHFVNEMFGEDIKIRFRASYFPFTEVSAEMDITCILCNGKGCNVCKQSGWVEIMGCGMVDPNVLKNCNIDPEKYSGFAFGMGIERITMLKYDIKDLRIFSQNDIRFLRQFSE